MCVSGQGSRILCPLTVSSHYTFINQNCMSQVASKLCPITSYEDAVEGLVTHGFITGVEEIGCFVTFYNDVKGLAHKCAFILSLQLLRPP